MNKLELKIYNLIKGNQYLKNTIRNIYQNIFDFFPREKEYFASTYDFKEGFFFGFHDITPFSRDNSKLLSNKVEFDLRMPNKGEGLIIGYFDLINGRIGQYYEIDKSFAWNYHKGCRLQWISQNEIIFNTMTHMKNVSKIINIQSKQSKQVDFPIDSICPSGLYASSFSFMRLEKKMPGYGYKHIDDEAYLDEPRPSKTGLFLVDLKNNKRKLLISIKELSSDLERSKYFYDYWHFVTHSEFSFDGHYLAALHRWTDKKLTKLWTRLVIYDLINETYFFLPVEEMVSHYAWNKNNQIIAFCKIDNASSHTLFNIPNIDKYTKINPKVLNFDGHQYFSNDNVFIMDAYPDRQRMSRIYKVNMENGEIDNIVSVFTPKKFQTRNQYSHIACDLHPRISPDGSWLCFDSSRTGKRAIYIMKLNY